MTTLTAPAVEPAKSKVPVLALHKFCEIIPACTEQEFKELKEDIKLNGLQIPIKIFDAKILDGRSRYRACRELEAEEHPIEFRKEVLFSSAKEVSDVDALAYVHQHERQATTSISFAACAYRSEVGDKQTRW